MATYSELIKTAAPMFAQQTMLNSNTGGGTQPKIQQPKPVMPPKPAVPAAPKPAPVQSQQQGMFGRAGNWLKNGWNNYWNNYENMFMQAYKK